MPEKSDTIALAATMSAKDDGLASNQKRRTKSIVAKLLCRETKVHPAIKTKTDKCHPSHERTTQKKVTTRPLLLLDIDETLVYSRTSTAIKTPRFRRSNSTGDSGAFTYRPGSQSMEATFTLLLGGQNISFHSQKRPFCNTFLKTMGRKFDIGLFTASCREYAEAIANWLDADLNIIKYLFHRDHCVWENGRLVKDIEFIRCDIKKTVIVDNSPTYIAKTPKNGLPCKSFYGDTHDSELRKLTELLVGLNTTSEDIRHELAMVKHELCILRKLRRNRASSEVAAEALCLPVLNNA